jgi:arabinose-5-phosphate isomerase
VSVDSTNDLIIVSSNTQLLDALLIMSQKALGMVLITHGKTLQGIFTDGDLRRVLETLALNSNSLEGQQNIQDITIGAVMTKNCKSISADKPAGKNWILLIIPIYAKVSE